MSGRRSWRDDDSTYIIHDSDGRAVRSRQELPRDDRVRRPIVELAWRDLHVAEIVVDHAPPPATGLFVGAGFTGAGAGATGFGKALPCS